MACAHNIKSKRCIIFRINNHTYVSVAIKQQTNTCRDRPEDLLERWHKNRVFLLIIVSLDKTKLDILDINCFRMLTCSIVTFRTRFNINGITLRGKIIHLLMKNYSHAIWLYGFQFNSFISIFIIHHFNESKRI